MPPMSKPPRRSLPGNQTAEGSASSSGAGLQHALVRGVAWTALIKWGSQVLSWGAVVVLARLLTPADYGLVGLAAVYLGFIGILTEGGLGTSIVAMRQMTEEEIAQVNSVAAMMGVTGSLITCVAAIPLGVFFKAPDLPWVVVALSSNAILASLRLVPVAVLQRELRFRGLALVDGAHAITSTAVTVSLAAAGWRYWALVAGAIVANVAAAVVSRMLSPHRFAWPRHGSLGRYLNFTRDILVGRVAWFVYTNADFLVAGRMLGTTALGAYTFAWNIASTPVEKVTALVTRVTPAFFSRLKHDRAELSRYLLTITEGLVFLTLPASVGMAVVADDFVNAYLGPQWLSTVVPLRILALYTTFRSVVTLLPQILTMLGDTRFLMINGLITALVLPLAFVVGSRWGGAGIAAMWVLVYPFHIAPLYSRTFTALGLSARRYLTAIWPTCRGTLVMLGALLGVRYLLPPDQTPLLRLILQVAIGAIVFAAAGFWPQRNRLRPMVRLIRPPSARDDTVPDSGG